MNTQSLPCHCRGYMRAAGTKHDLRSSPPREIYDPRAWRATVAAIVCLGVGLSLLPGCRRGSSDAPIPSGHVTSAPGGPVDYISNRSTRIVHRSDCAFAKRIAQANRTAFTRLDNALAEGYRPCKRCLGGAGSSTTGRNTR